LTYWYGHPDTKSNPQLLDRLIRNLGVNVLERHDVDPQARVSGLIVDTPSSFASGPSSGSSADSRHTLIKACVDTFHINVILVVGHEKLNAEMQRLFGNQLTVVKIPKSGGVVELDHSYRERVHNYQLHAYMYGERIDPPPGVSSGLVGREAATELILSPSSSIINFGDLAIYRIGLESMAPSSALPIGATRILSELQPTLLDPASSGARLFNKVLALLAPFNEDPNERYDEEVLDLPAVGFLVITSLDMPNKKMTILAPNQGQIAGGTAILGSFEWTE
jgi:polyribonucleotide 5'-hydroxyl-kinase